MLKQRMIVGIIVVMLVSNTFGDVLRVPGEYANIQLAIDDAVNGDTVLVADGIYKGSGNRHIIFNGYAITVKSENGPENCIIDVEGAADIYGFYFHQDEDENSILDGFTIINTDRYGICCWNSSPTIKNCIIKYSGKDGIYLYCGSCSPTISGCVISDNSGNGINCLLASVTVSRCILRGNGTGIYYGYDSDAIINNCLIVENGIAVNFSSTGNLTVSNCTITGNDNGLMCGFDNSVATVNNCIFWDNFIKEIYSSKQVNVTVEYCDVKDGQVRVDVPPETLTWNDNIDADPCFVSFLLSNYFHLLSDSPCIDAGTNNPPGGLPTTDIEGNSRKVDGDDDQVDIVDIGAYEYDPANSRVAASPPIVEFVTPYRGWDPDNKILSICNIGSGTLNWSISGGADWLTVSPQSGESTGNVNEVILSVDASGLSYGTHECILAVNNSSATNIPRNVVPVILNVGEQEADDGSIIDIMINYDLDDLASPEEIEDMQYSAKTVVNLYNRVLENSQINPRLRLVYAGPVYPTSTGNPDPVLDPHDGIMDEIFPLRDIFAADIVGVAISHGKASGDFFFGVGESYVSVHEMGHTLTLPDNITGLEFYCADYGHYHKTMMCQNSGTIPHFSNPDVFYHGTATGTLTRNSAGQVNENAYQIANRRPAAIKRIIYVDADASGYNDGSCWEDAFTDLQDALAEYDGKYGHMDEIWVAEGTYTPGLARTNTFRLVQGVMIYGGFNGTETSLQERNPNLYTTILSGDIGTVGVTSDNCYHVITGPGGDFRALHGFAALDGFTISGGNADGTGNDGKVGGGIYIVSSSPTIRSCIIKDNEAENDGGGIYISDSDSRIVSCIFVNNTANEGAGMFCDESRLTILNCTFTENSADIFGGAICCSVNSEVVVTNCILWNDTATDGQEIAVLPSNATVKVEYSNIDGGNNDVYVDVSSTLNWNEGNIDSNPCFINADDNNFHLDLTSPCINSGAPNGNYTDEYDIDGDSRVYAGIADMGADEIVHLAYNVIQEKFYLNIQDAINGANDDDIIEVYDGIFSEAINFNNKAITVKKAILNESFDVVINPGDPSANVITFDSGEDAQSVLSGFVLTGGKYGVYCSNSSAPRILNCIIKANTDSGVYLSGAGPAEIRNDTIIDNSTAGIYVASGSTPSVTNCIIWNNNDDLYGCSATYSCIQNGDGGTGNISNNPLFVSPSNCDYHLLDGSPCINTGDPDFVSDNETDIDGDSRVKAKRVDMGVDEAGAVYNIDKNLWYLTIQSAVDESSNGDEIEIHEGIYTGQGNRDIDFGGKAIAVRSTDPYDWKVVEATIIDCQGTRFAPHRGFYFHSGETSNSVISGLTIRNGYGDLQDNFNAGGAVFCTGSSPIISRCLMTSNFNDLDATVAADGGGIACYAEANPQIINCIISDNAAMYSGGISCWDSNPTIEGCIINNNTVGGMGGGINCYNSNAIIINCTIAENSASYGGGGLYNYEASPEVTNCILWDNSTDEICNFSNSFPNISYCDIEGCGGSSDWDDDFGNNLGGNIDTDPMFVDPDNDIYYLDTSSSPCFDAGDPDYDPEGGEKDIEGDDRVMNGRIDMGADELACLSRYDTHYNNWLYWGKPECWCYKRQCRGDIDGLYILVELAKIWVSSDDQDIFTAAFNKTDAQLAAIPNGICADIDHIKSGPFRVAIPDLNIFRDYFEQPEENVPTCEDTVEVNFWTN